MTKAPTPGAMATIKEILSTFGPLFGAFFGALGAYYVGRFKERRDEEKRQHTALLTTQYALYSQWSVVGDIHKTFLAPLKKDANRHLKQKIFYRVGGEVKVSFDELTFITTSEQPNLLQEIHIAEKRFLSSVEMLDRLNGLKVEMQKHKPANFNMSTGKGTIEVPAHEIFLIKEATDLLYDEVSKALTDLKTTNEALHTFTKKHLKGKKALKFEPIEEPKPKT